MSELKPCPFCSATPMLYDLLDTHGGFSVECPTVGCDTDKMKRTKAEAIQAWNRRVQPAQAVPVLTRDEIVSAWLAVEHIAHATQRQEAFASGIEHAVRAKMGAGVGWIACVDRMPPPDTWLLVTWGDGVVDKAHTCIKWKHSTNPLGYLIQGHPGSHNDVTHWQPLPPPPGIVGKEGGNA